jgi:CRISPR system Cascade subunit CasB
MTQPVLSETKAQTTFPETIPSVVARITHAFEKRLSGGERAELRRMTPEDPGCPAFWRIVAQDLEPSGLLPKGESARLESERSWAAVLSGMAVMQGLLQVGRRPGHALAEAGFSEQRLARLLRARREGLEDMLRGVARFLASKGQAVDWAPLAQLILHQDEERGEVIRRAIARDYYGSLPKNDASNA